jgi:hypothetical protein
MFAEFCFLGLISKTRPDVFYVMATKGLIDVNLPMAKWWSGSMIGAPVKIANLMNQKICVLPIENYSNDRSINQIVPCCLLGLGAYDIFSVLHHRHKHQVPVQDRRAYSKSRCRLTADSDIVLSVCVAGMVPLLSKKHITT